MASHAATAATRQDGARDIMVHAEGVTKTFGQGAGKITALDDVTVDIRKNEFFTLLGPSGCGKTTLLRLIAGFELPDQWPDPAGRSGNRASAAVQAACEHGVPVLRALSAHERGAQHRLRP